MIRSYTVGELEEISGCTRRTISDYIAKGVLSGPSQRGRGARYPQKDLDVLTVLPRIRTLMKREYPTLKDVSEFLDELSVRDVNRLATRGSEDAFVSEARRLRVRNSLMGLLPYVPPERIESLLSQLTPGQVRGIDSGRYQVGAVMDIEGLLREEKLGHRAPDKHVHAGNAYQPSNETGNGSGVHHPNGHDRNGHDKESSLGNDMDASWSVSWLNGHEEGAALSQPEDVTSDPDAFNSPSGEMVDTTPDLSALLMRNEKAGDEVLPADGGPEEQVGGNELRDRLTEIAERLEKLESILDKA